MYGAKTSGRARHKLFEAQQHIHALANMRLESELHQAIESQQFHVYYQPVLSLTDNRIVSVEALIRWQHPQRGLLEPSEFVEIAEETGLIVPINDWVLRTACIQTKTWHDMGYTHLQLSVNVSSRQFEQKHLLKLIQSIFEETALSPHTLILEIVEQTALKNVNMILETMLDLKDMGIQFAVDDFGIGTSIGLLKQLPFDILKIDQSFVRSMNKSDAAIVVAIIAMAHSLQLKIIAEGVETNTQLEFLHSHQCDFIQGYLISREGYKTSLFNAIFQANPQNEFISFLDSFPLSSNNIYFLASTIPYRVIQENFTPFLPGIITTFNQFCPIQRPHLYKCYFIGDMSLKNTVRPPNWHIQKFRWRSFHNCDIFRTIFHVLFFL